VEYYAGTALIGSATGAPYAFTWSNVAAGSYSLSAKAIATNPGQARQDPATHPNMPTWVGVSAPVTFRVQAVAQVYYIHPDHLNTPRFIADATQKIVWRWDQQEPFGSTPPNDDPDGDGVKFDFPLRFPGQYFDRETNLAYNAMRDYDPGIGRYVESDLIGLDGGLNTYLYVAANPITGFDPSGTQTIIITPNNQSDLPNDNVLLGLICMSKCLRAPINLESGTRTPAWDKDPSVGGSGSGPHTRGNAADVIPMPSMPKLRKAAAECGFYVLPREYRTRPHVHIEMRGLPKEDPDECVCKQIREGP